MKYRVMIEEHLFHRSSFPKRDRSMTRKTPTEFRLELFMQSSKFVFYILALHQEAGMTVWSSGGEREVDGLNFGMLVQMFVGYV
jgi:hypothetical protein